MKWRVVNKNIKDWSSDELFDGVLCDPPYELGFMGKSWDSSGIAYDVEMWRNIFDHLKPGAHLLAFSGSRTYHRMACAIEDAGFEIRDMIEYIYGSGFPKSLNIGKAVDKIQGNEREVIGEYQVSSDFADHKGSMMSVTNSGGKNKVTSVSQTKGTSEWEGYGTALKPAHEPICMARKPLAENTVAENCLKWGTGGINIDESRVEANEELGRNNNARTEGTSYVVQKETMRIDNSNGKRFPANLIHDGSDEVVGLFPETKQPSMRKGDRASKVNGIVPWNKGRETGRTVTNAGYTDIGSAARFFYTAKASKSERNAGLEGFEEEETVVFTNGKAGKCLIHNKSNPSGLNTYSCGCPIQYSKERKVVQPNSNHHPTVKPLSLTKYLATLIKPPTGGRLLVPFSGSGSEMIGALQAGWDYVEGIELTEEYIPIAEARIKYWTKQPVQEELL